MNSVICRALLAAACCSLVSSCAVAQNADAAKGQTIWVEGESAQIKNVKPHPFWYDQVNKSQLSGGAWLSHFSDTQSGSAEFQIDVAVAAKYHFWLRANPVKSKLSYQIGNGPWKAVNFAENTVDQQNLAADGKPDLRFLAWTNIGQFNIAKGPLAVRFKMEKAEDGPQYHGAIDALVLTTLDFAPSGTLRPGQSTLAAPVAASKDSWVFNPSNDPFKADAVFDLRSLNEKEAGQSGFLKRSADGNDFVLGNGQPARFWCANTTIYRKSQEDMDRQARFLAKIGVNMVRMHGSFSPKAKDSKISDVDREEIDRCWKLVAAMKKQGIYTTISPYWANGGHAGTKASWGIQGHGDGADLWGVMFFNDDLKAAYKQWVKVLYSEKNPYTGVALKDEPAVGIIQIQNEDSLFFWTLSGLKPEQLAILQNKYVAWLVAKYGSLDATRAAWKNTNFPRDDWGKGKPDIDIWRSTQGQEVLGEGGLLRIRDQVRFLGELQFNFYKEIADWYRGLGCKQLINANNWTTADAEKLGDIERWTYTATDVIAVNKYYNGGQHIGPNTGYRIDVGNTFENQSVLKNPTALPMALKQVAGYPMIITESTWVPPLGYQSEAPFLVAAYSALSGVDGFYWFSLDNPEYNVQPYFPWETYPNGEKPLFMWSLPPGVQTNFPAAALMYRLNYIQRGETVVHEERSLDNLWNRTTPLLTEGRTFDPNRQAEFAEGSAVKSMVDPLAFLVGRVEVKLGGDPTKSRVMNLSKFIDKSKGLTRSTTGELTWDAQSGVCVLNAPKAQGATGFLKSAGTVKTADMTLQANNEYATVIAVPLDDKPLKTSTKVLLQIGTQIQPTGYATQPTEFKSEDGKKTMRGEKIVATGKMPWQVVNTQMTLTLQNPNISKATLLDAFGYRQNDVSLSKAGGSVKLTLPKDAMYLVLE